jgi:hypothetical protein
MIFELDRKRVGDWDDFQVRKIGFGMQGRKFESLLSLVPEWTTDQKQRLERIVEAKSNCGERL